MHNIYTIARDSSSRSHTLTMYTIYIEYHYTHIQYVYNSYSRTSHMLLRDIYLRKGNVLRKHDMHEENIAASVLLKLLINGYERCHTTDDL